MQKNIKQALFVILLFLHGCGLFDSREVEPPSESRSTFIQPTSPDLVLTNLIFSISEKNLDNYMRCFVDSNFSNKRFRYFPDALSQASYPVFQSWNLSSERVYYSNLISATDPNAASNLFADNYTINTAIDSAIMDMDYIFVFGHNRQNVAVEAKGKLRFVMATDTRGLWSIYDWYDFTDKNNDTTWSVVKANFIN
ncbi:MAG TPA: hypothetical protein PKA90_13930 [Ignavibacteria bacterium]|nr:hypothetical protein [Ignavibacteria bacterium]HMR41518.1 hypothetical protein [Ignavibacteria bacterium]